MTRRHAATGPSCCCSPSMACALVKSGTYNSTDIDWQHDRLRVRRSKSGRLETFPLEPSVGNAIIGYCARAGR